MQADVLYFADERHTLDHGESLVLVECKRFIKDLQAATWPPFVWLARSVRHGGRAHEGRWGEPADLPDFGIGTQRAVS
jgi:hypothetical protein